jgi:hypothetical protein
MLLAAHGAYKPLAASDPFWSNVRYMQTFDGLTVGSTIAATWPNLKSGQSYTGSDAIYQVVSSPSVFGNALKQTTFGGPFLTITGGISGVFTVEFSARVNAASIPSDYHFGQIQNTSNVAMFIVDVSGGFFRTNNLTTTVTSSINATVNTWYDIAIARDASNNVRTFINGQLATTQTQAASLGRVQVPMKQFSPITADTYFIDDFRITAACRYTASYTPSHPFPAA